MPGYHVDIEPALRGRVSIGWFWLRRHDGNKAIEVAQSIAFYWLDKTKGADRDACDIAYRIHLSYSDPKP